MQGESRKDMKGIAIITSFAFFFVSLRSLRFVFFSLNW